MLILQSLAALMVVAYWVSPSFGNLFAPFVAWHAAWGWRAAFLCQAFFCGILPGLFLLLFRGIRPRRVGHRGSELIDIGTPSKARQN